MAATGPWVNRLAAPLGETLPITPIRVQMVHLRRPPSLESLTTNVIDYTTGGYYRVNAGFKTLVGGEATEDMGEVVNPDAFGLNADHDTITRFWDRAEAALSRFRRRDANGRLRLAVRHDSGRQPGPRRCRESIEGLYWADRIQRTRVQAVAGGGPDGGGAGDARREQGPSDSRSFAQARFAEGDLLEAEYPYEGRAHQ